MTGIAIALAFLCLALASTLLPVGDRYGLWLPLHLAMAGAASTAIAAVMPFFSAAFATAQPVDARIRWASVAAVAVGALGLSVGFVWPAHQLAAVAGSLYLVGIGLTAFSTLRPVAGALGPSGGVVTWGYTAALIFVAIGGSLAVLRLAGVEAILSAWGGLKPAHAWLNLVGFVSLVIATTLLHFFPTVIGARIKRSRWAYACVAGLAAGAALVPAGLALELDLLARVGAVVSLIGAASLAVYAWETWRTRARWTGDRGWHVFAMGGLVSAIAWFGLGLTLAAGRILVAGADPTIGTEVLVAPFTAGWMGLALLASATHLVPSVGPGGPHAHTDQRRLLGRGGAARLAIADLGIAALVAGATLGLPTLEAAGVLLAAVALLATTALIAVAVARGIADARRSDTLRVSSG